MDTTLGSQHVKGTRLFWLNPKTLLLESLTRNDPEPAWQPDRIKKSVCGHAKHHGDLQPVAECTCGIWSCKSRSALAMAFPPVFYFPGSHGKVTISARIEQWGVVIEHQSGYRSEYARIIPKTIQWWPRRASMKQQHKLLNHLRQKYGATH